MGVTKVAVGCPRLEKLRFKWCREIYDIGIDLLAKKCPKLNISYLKLATLKETLTMLKLDGLEVSDTLLQAIGESNRLVEIGLSKCSGVTDEGISSLVTRCSDLRTIDLTCRNLITNNALDSIDDNCEMLQRLRLE